MKKVALFVMLVAFMSAGLMAAESVDQLTPEQSRDYLSRALSVQTKDHTEYSGFGHTSSWGLTTVYGEGETTTEWIPYQGAREISKGAFLEMTGYPDLAAEANRVEELNKNLDIAGWVFLGTGVALSIIGPCFLAGDFDLGFTVGPLFVGMICAVISVPLLCINVNDDISISFAAGIANNYNRGLLSDY